MVPDETRQALEAQWVKQQARIAGVDAGQEGQVYTQDDVDEYKQAKTGLDLGGYLRSRQIARFFFTRKFRLPDEPDSAAYDPNLD